MFKRTGKGDTLCEKCWSQNRGGKKMKEIKIKLSEKEMDAIEDVFFCDLSRDEYLNISLLLSRVWKRMCRGMGK